MINHWGLNLLKSRLIQFIKLLLGNFKINWLIIFFFLLILFLTIDIGCLLFNQVPCLNNLTWYHLNSLRMTTLFNLLSLLINTRWSILTGINSSCLRSQTIEYLYGSWISTVITVLVFIVFLFFTWQWWEFKQSFLISCILFLKISRLYNLIKCIFEAGNDSIGRSCCLTINIWISILIIIIIFLLIYFINRCRLLSLNITASCWLLWTNHLNLFVTFLIA